MELMAKLKGIFVRKGSFSSKIELNLSSFKWLGIVGLAVFVVVVLVMPNELPVEFSEKIEPSIEPGIESSRNTQAKSDSKQLWSAPKRESFGAGGDSRQINYNTAMIIGSGGNAKSRLHSGVRLPLRILDKVVVSQESVPVLAELLMDSETESGLKLQAGTKFYGEATFMKGSDRALVQFKQIALLNGQLKAINARAIGKDGRAGLPGRVYSDGAKNTAGQVITSFVGGLAAGSVQTDIFGRSQGGIGNGILTAVAETARGKAQSYGENLKAEREWIELQPNSECDAQLSEAMDLQSGSSIE